MRNTLENDQHLVWREPLTLLLAAGVVFALLIFIFYEGLGFMVELWATREEYGHGYIIPFITAFLIWQKKDQLENTEFLGSWIGVLIVVFGLFLFFAGELSSIYTIIQYAFLVSLYGVVLSMTGLKAFKIIVVPLIILVFMIPLPNFLFNNLSFFNSNIAFSGNEASK